MKQCSFEPQVSARSPKIAVDPDGEPVIIAPGRDGEPLRDSTTVAPLSQEG